MAKEGLFGQLKEIIPDMVDGNGNFRVTPVGRLGKRGLSNNRIKLLTDIIKLLTETKIITEESKYYIQDRYITMKGVHQEFEANWRKEGEMIGEKSTQTKIQYDQRKIKEIFGQDVFADISLRSNDITNYERIVVEQYIKYSNKDNIRNNLMINIPRDCITSELSEEKFDALIKSIMPYIRSHVKFIEDNMEEDVCGYFNYLLSSPRLEGIHKERESLIRELLGGTVN